jgi:hypothetical protein
MNITQANLQLLAKEGLESIKPHFERAELAFSRFFSSYNFTGFCVVYSVILIYLLMRCTARTTWRPNNQKPKSNRDWT